MREFDTTQLQDARPMILKLAEKKGNITFDNLYKRPTTLGTPKKSNKNYKTYMAMDACIRNVLSNFKNDLSFAAFPAFVGYAMLSSVSQEALIRAGVETISDEMTRKFITWTYDDDNGKEDKEKIINQMETEASKYKLKETFNEAMMKDGLFGGCLVYIDVGDIDDDEKEEPLILDKKTFKKGSFRGFKVIEPVNIAPGNYNTTDPTDKNYFKPEWWYILGKRYHASRFLYFASNDTPVLLKPAYNFFGIPQAQLALDYVAHFVANREAAQELLNKFSLTCFGTDMSQGLQANGSWSDLIARMKMFNKLKTNNGTFVYNKETEELSQINTPLGGVREIVEMSLNLLTAVWRIPKIKYIGEGEGGLNASSKEQMRSFYDYIMSMKEKCFTQPLETVLKIFQLNLGLDIDESLGFKYPQMWDMDDADRASLNKQQADRDAIYLANGVLSQEEVRRRLSLDKNSEYSMIDVDELPEPTEQPLQDVDKEEQDETERQAMDMAFDKKKDDIVNDFHIFRESDLERFKGRFFKWFHKKKLNESPKTLNEAEDFAKKFVSENGHIHFDKENKIENVNIMNETINNLMNKYDVKKIDEYGSDNKYNECFAYSLNNTIKGNSENLLNLDKDELEKSYDEFISGWDKEYKEKKYALENSPYDFEKMKNENQEHLKFNKYTYSSSPKNFIKDTFTHEFGHYIFRNSSIGIKEANLLSEEALKIARDTGFIYKISLNANRDNKEFFAECFLMREYGEKLPDYIKNMLKEISGK